MTYGITPDLSKSFHPVPKPTPKSKKTPKPIKPGKKTIAWDDARDQLKKKFAAGGITTCEIRHEPGCWKSNALTFAHLDKRRYLTEAQLYEVVLCCTPCHMWLEGHSREMMHEILEEIMSARKGVK